MNECRTDSKKHCMACEHFDYCDRANGLKNEVFELNGIDEELFVQDIEGIESSGTNWDFTHPKEVFDILLIYRFRLCRRLQRWHN